MIERESGVVIHIGSVAARLPFANRGTTTTLQSALDLLSQDLQAFQPVTATESET
jgi:NADP-dependent 3-hydroxy acid dehydrogenase YdfG